MIAQGGGNWVLNHHSTHRAQRYAVDIVAVNAAGFRAAGIQPDDPTRYLAFDAAVVSPCDGEVMKAQDGLADLNPPEADPQNVAGNHVVVACSGMLVELAHLREGSIEVEAGDMVALGERIASVGNSGNTTEPHLHIHAVDAVGGQGIQITFDGVVPARNRTFRH
jgi:hypothetical protein